MEAERRVKLDEIAEKQRRRMQEIEERSRENGLARPSDRPRPVDEAVATPAAVAVAAAPTSGKYVPKFRRAGADAPPTEALPSTDRWRCDDHRPFGGTGARWSSSSSSRIPQRGG